MISSGFYFSLTIILLILNNVFYISRVKEVNLYFLKYVIPIFISFLIICFILNFQTYLPSKVPELGDKTIFIIFSQIILFFSIALFILTIIYKHEDIIDLNTPSFLKSRKGDIEIGRVIDNNFKKHRFFLSIDDLEKHMFVCGSTGTGKSNFVQNFLINFKKHYQIPFLLVEFKGEYCFLKHYIKDLLILRPGENFSINIFNPEGSNPEIHAERIFDILKSGQFLEESAEYSPQMQKVLVEILAAVCKHEKFQNWKGFFKVCDHYLERQKADIPMLSQTLISIKNRIRRFSVGPLKVIFSSNYEFDIKQLFKKNILIDLSSIIRLGGEKEDALFFLNMILKYLWDANLTKNTNSYDGINHITIVEDAQYFAPKDLTKQSKISTYLEDIALLQRGRGECLISIATRPQVSEEILANCGILVVFKNHMEKLLQCKLLNLNEQYEYYLSIIEKGQCIIRTDSVKRPFLLWVPFRERTMSKPSLSMKKSLIYDKIKRNTIQIKIPGRFNQIDSETDKDIQPNLDKKNIKKPQKRLHKNKQDMPENADFKEKEKIKVPKSKSINSNQENFNEFKKLIEKIIIDEKSNK